MRHTKARRDPVRLQRQSGDFCVVNYATLLPLVRLCQELHTLLRYMLIIIQNRMRI